MLLGDWPILATVAGWAVTCAATPACVELVAPTTQRRRDRAATRSRRSRPARSARAGDRRPASRVETRSTSSVRSSRRALRSAISSCSSRSSRPIALLSSPLISPRLRATGSTSRRMPSCTASPIRSGIDVSSASAAAPSASTSSRERRSATSNRPSSLRPARASAMRCFARSSACSSMSARLLWPSDEIGRARLRPAARADRAASRRPPGCLATARLRPRHGRRPPSNVQRPAVRARRRARRRQRHQGRPCAAPPAARERRRGRGAAARAARRRGLGSARAAVAAAARRGAARPGRAARVARRRALARAPRR